MLCPTRPFNWGDHVEDHLGKSLRCFLLPIIHKGLVVRLIDLLLQLVQVFAEVRLEIGDWVTRNLTGG